MAQEVKTLYDIWCKAHDSLLSMNFDLLMDQVKKNMDQLKKTITFAIKDADQRTQLELFMDQFGFKTISYEKDLSSSYFTTPNVELRLKISWQHFQNLEMVDTNEKGKTKEKPKNPIYFHDLTYYSYWMNKRKLVLEQLPVDVKAKLMKFVIDEMEGRKVLSISFPLAGESPIMRRTIKLFFQQQGLIVRRPLSDVMGSGFVKSSSSRARKPLDESTHLQLQWHHFTGRHIREICTVIMDENPDEYQLRMKGIVYGNKVSK